MCDACGCDLPIENSTDSKIIEVHQSLLKANTEMADLNRSHFRAMGTVVINLISSPGSGKTTLLEHTIEQLDPAIKIGVIEGDIETERDADRIRTKGVPVVQITTGGACHLDAAQIHKGLHRLQHEYDINSLDLLFIENVGNLVCPATFDLGEDIRVVLVSVPEGPDKPAKYPRAFLGSHAFIISKTDLLPYFDFPVAEARREALEINPKLEVMELSATTGDGFEQWLSYLRQLVQHQKTTNGEK